MSAGKPSRSSLASGEIYKDVADKRNDCSLVTNEAELEVAEIQDDNLVFCSEFGMEKAVEDGVFYLKIPEAISLDLLDRFACEFFTGKERYGKFRGITGEEIGDPLLGFHTRVDQVEQFLLERRFWKAIYPDEVNREALKLTDVSKIVVQAILSYSDIPASMWHQATGGCSEAEGSYHLTFNHYRPQVLGVGLSSHKDDGFLTILRVNSDGLEVNKDSVWERVPIRKDCFVINFGLAMEMLTRQSQHPISAILHRVSQQSFSRTSFGHFSSSRCEPGNDLGIFSYDPEVGLKRVCSSRELIDCNDSEIYEGSKSEVDS